MPINTEYTSLSTSGVQFDVRAGDGLSEEFKEYAQSECLMKLHAHVATEIQNTAISAVRHLVECSLSQAQESASLIARYNRHEAACDAGNWHNATYSKCIIAAAKMCKSKYHAANGRQTPALALVQESVNALQSLIVNYDKVAHRDMFFGISFLLRMATTLQSSYDELFS